MIGKITALGLAGLLQSVSGLALPAVYRYFVVPVWTSAASSRSRVSPVFCLLRRGYLLYASLMAAVGALVSNVKEASQ